MALLRRSAVTRSSARTMMMGRRYARDEIARGLLRPHLLPIEGREIQSQRPQHCHAFRMAACQDADEVFLVGPTSGVLVGRIYLLARPVKHAVKRVVAQNPLRSRRPIAPARPSPRPVRRSGSDGHPRLIRLCPREAFRDRLGSSILTIRSVPASSNLDDRCPELSGVALAAREHQHLQRLSCRVQATSRMDQLRYRKIRTLTYLTPGSEPLVETFITQAFRIAPAAVVAPHEYTALVWRAS